MPYTPHYLLSFGGRLGTDEIWTNTIRLGNNAGVISTPRPTVETILGDMMEQMADVYGDLGYSSAAYLDWAKLNPIGPDGRYPDDWDTVELFDLGITSGNTAQYPFQVAMGVSWQTTRPRGPSSKGRIYVPSPWLPVNPSSGRIESTQLGNVTNNWASLLTQWNLLVGQFDDGGNPESQPVRMAVASNVGPAGLTSPITSVRIGDVLDTQRRRRNALVEEYESASVGI